ncbi:MAG: ATP-binding protein, partial [Ktedonobacteraceae bacterium]|nr:ATP-binding protein [Ktedonobacteraceae bacterium]
YLPDDFLDRTFQSYLELVLSPEQRQAAEQVETFVRTRMEDYRGKKRGLYLFGSWGVGKTGLAISALGQALAAGKSGLYLPTTKLFASLYDAIAASERMRAGYGDDEDRQEESMGSRLLRQVEQVEWLVLDDLGVECASCFVISKLYQILEERRHQMGLYTIFTSNKDARSLLSHWRPEGRNVPAFEDAERIMQRIGEHCMSLHLMGHSLRERH